ncbi:AEC family transporter [Oleidesulfovibrio sp.]|uniref:AEC family transporter n=1 Tax=Oleidesulfovibrio sp. TaxID=2909707 RepID=UPI003A83AFE2
MLTIFYTILPVFLLIIVGGYVQRAGWLPKDGAAALNQYVYRIALPALLFGAIAQASPERLLKGSFIGALLLGLAICYGLSFALFRLFYRASIPLAGFQAFTATFANAAFLGLPILMALFPDNPDVVLVMGIYTLFTMPFVLMGIAMLELGRQQRNGTDTGAIWRTVFRSLISNPILLATGGGLILSLSGMALPQWLESVCNMLGYTASPCALIAVGMVLALQAQMTGGPKPDAGYQAVSGCIKLIVHPALVWAGMKLFGVEGEWIAMGVLMAAMPMGTLAFVLAETYNTDCANTSASVLLTTIFSFFTVSAAMALLSG